jgi:hypothetical protein
MSTHEFNLKWFLKLKKQVFRRRMVAPPDGLERSAMQYPDVLFDLVRNYDAGCTCRSCRRPGGCSPGVDGGCT